jgi:DNA-binding NtrC family response regulator
MPGLDGMDLLSLAKEHDKDVWIQRVTTFGSLASAKEALRRGAFDYLSKPFRKEQLHLALDQAWRWQEMTLQIKELKGQQEKD